MSAISHLPDDKALRGAWEAIRHSREHDPVLHPKFGVTGPGSRAHPFESFDIFIVYLSGGKDSIGAYLMLLRMAHEAGGQALVNHVCARTEFWHHLVDGREGTTFGRTLWDWPVTENYVVKLSEAFNVPVYFSWRMGGIEGEVIKQDREDPAHRTVVYPHSKQKTRPARFECPDHLYAPNDPRADGCGNVYFDPNELFENTLKHARSFAKQASSLGPRQAELAKEDVKFYEREACGLGPNGVVVCTAGGLKTKIATRLKYPAPDPPNVRAEDRMKMRWCTPNAKVDVGRMAINNHPRFLGKKTLTISGERAEESGPRERLEFFEPDRDGNATNREVWRCRPVHHLKLPQIWRMMEDGIGGASIRCHPCYDVGFGRCSCMTCVYPGPNAWATIMTLDPRRVAHIAEQEIKIGKTFKQTSISKNAAARLKSIGIDVEPNAKSAPVPITVFAALGTPYNYLAKDAQRVMNPLFKDEVFVDPKTWLPPVGFMGEAEGPT